MSISQPAIFRFLKMAAAAILDFLNFESLTIIRVKAVRRRQATKCHGNRSNHWWDVVIFRFFHDGGRPPSWICDACSDHPRRAFGDLHHYAKLGWNRCSIVSIIWELSHRDPRKALPCAEICLPIVKIGPSVRARREPKLKKNKDIGPAKKLKRVTSHVFAETTHVVATPHGLACVVIPTTYRYTQAHVYSKFIRSGF